MAVRTREVRAFRGALASARGRPKASPETLRKTMDEKTSGQSRILLNPAPSPMDKGAKVITKNLNDS